MVSKKQSKKPTKIPINLMDRFRAKVPTDVTRRPVISEVRKLQHVFSSTDIPDLPIPSSSLKKLLFEFNNLAQDENIIKHPSLARKKTKTLISYKINGFIAFRSFYAKSIPNPVYQRKLSRSLADIWSEEENKEVWERYSQMYKVSKAYLNNKTFVEWLCERLKLDHDRKCNVAISRMAPTNHTVTKSWEFVSRHNVVEDIYL